MLSLSYGCKKALLNQETELNAVSMAKNKTDGLLDTEVGVGKKLNNPYTVANMQKALANLATKGDVKKVAKLITTSHYYIKFMPKNEADLALLKVDTTLVIYPFPLDVKLSNNGVKYREPGLPDGVPTYQYAAVPVSYKLPKVAYEVLADLYLPNERSPKSKVAESALKSLGAPEVTVQRLVNEAEDIACDESIDDIKFTLGDCEYGGGTSGGGCGAPPGEWRPSGRITMVDDVLGLIGVEGLEIRARRWFTTYKGTTDANGYYCVAGTFTRPANYWFKFEIYQFGVNDHGGGAMDIIGPKREAPWNYHLVDYEKFCGVIFRAAYHYYHKDIQGLRRPPQNGFWNTQLRIGAYDYANSENGNHLSIRDVFGIGAVINIFHNTYSTSLYPFTTDESTYATTIHELAHAVHWDMQPNGYSFTNDRVTESWATGVQWVLTKMVYQNYLGRPNPEPPYNIPNFKNYTNFVMDLMDYPGQEYTYTSSIGGVYFHGKGSPTDQVQGYTILQIQTALLNVWTLEQWKDNLFDQNENTTENNLYALYLYWNNL